ncbi:MAG: hypothetical protein PHY16_11185 [Methylobacter sp.]|nr:hypothetical protein [Methylobacter sp.]
MNNKAIKIGLLTGLLLVAAGHAGTVSAHDIAASLGILKGAGATDLYTVTCSTDPTEQSQQPTDHLFVQIQDQNAGGAILSVQVMKGAIAVNSTDNIGGDGIPAPAITLQGGEGDYLVLVDHTARFAETYFMSYHCQDANNQHTGTVLTTKQNQ